MDFSTYFPVWNRLTPAEQDILCQAAVLRTVKKGTILHNGTADCLGLLLLKSGQMRTFIYSDEGREITLYRLFERDICLFSAACILKNIQFDLSVEAEKDTEIWVIPAETFKQIMYQSLPMASYMNEVMASKFSDVMTLIEQIMWKRFDKRLASFLLNEAALEESMVLNLTQERIANHLGSAREVVNRMLKYFQLEGLVKVSRGTVEILDERGLLILAEEQTSKDA